MAALLCAAGAHSGTAVEEAEEALAMKVRIEISILCCEDTRALGHRFKSQSFFTIRSCMGPVLRACIELWRDVEVLPPNNVAPGMWQPSCDVPS